jgi:hypothetical protein
MNAYARPEVWLPTAALSIALLVCLGLVVSLNAARTALEDQRRCAPGIIYFGVQAALTAALSAHGADSLNAAHRLVSAIRHYLGPVLDLTDGAKSALDRLEKALKGKVKDTAADLGGGGPRVILVPAGGSGASAEAVSTAGVSVATATVEGAGGYHVVVTPPPPGAIKPAGDDKPKERDATTEEHIRAVRDAIEVFALYWQRDAIERKLRLAQEALLISKAIKVEDVRVEDVFPKTNTPDSPGRRGGFKFGR